MRTFLAATIGILLGAVVVGVLLWTLRPSPREPFESGTVERVIDGDTVELASGERVRYLGLDTPELLPEPDCGATDATELNRALVEGKRVELLRGPDDRDQFGRLLRYVFVDGIFVNAELIHEGMAQPQGFHPDERFRQVLVQMAVAARAAGRGLWAVCDWR